jgi:nucleoid DNA-binding protein
MEISVLSRIMLDLLLKGKSVSLEGIGLFSFRRQLVVAGDHDESEDVNDFSMNFNPSINFRDSNLIVLAAEALGIPESQAELIVGRLLRNIKGKMSRGEAVFLEGIGELTQDTDGSFLFCPKPDFMATSNFDFFNSDNDDLHIIQLESSSNKKRHQSIFPEKKYAILAILLISFIGLGIAIFYKFYRNEKVEHKTIVPLVEKTNVKPIQEDQIIENNNPVFEVENKPQPLVNSEKPNLPRIALFNMGEFTVEEDALKLEVALKKLSYDARVMTEGNLFKVVVFSPYKEESELRAALLSLRRNFVSQAFIENFNYSNN